MEAEERPNKRRRVSEDEALQPKDINGLSSAPAIKLGQVEPEVENASMTNGDVTGQVANGHADALQNPPKTGLQASINGDENAVPTPDKTAPIVDAINIDKITPPMSKNQQKKLKRDLEWESKRDERKIIRKQKLTAKRERKRAARDEASANGDPQSRPSGRPHKAALLPVTILIDCDFDDLMRDPERKSLAAQITRSYSDNRKAPFRAHLAICSFGGHLRERFDNVLTHYKGWKGVRFLDCDFVEAPEQAKEWMLDPQYGGTMAGAFSKFVAPAEESEIHSKLREEAETVYLTSDSDYTLTELKPYSTYIIGGLVDKNREKGICYKRATERGIKTARLPIGEFMDMRSRKVLATNHVNEIMVRWLECGDWGEAFMKVIPKRKGGKLKGAAGEGDADRSPEQENEAGDQDDLEVGAGDRDDVEVASDHSEARDEPEFLPSELAEESHDTTVRLEG